MSRNPITLEALEILDAIDRRGSFAKAAEELDKATSALSYGVQKLEEQLDITLFTREGRRSVLTPAGRLVLEQGREILRATSELADRAREVATGWEPRLRIAIDSVTDGDAIFAVIADFLLRHPSIELDITESVLNGSWDALEHDRVDLLIGAPGPVPQQKGYRAIELGRNNLVPVVASHHPLARYANEPNQLQQRISESRRVITHDTSQQGVARSAGMLPGKRQIYVQTMEQKVAAQRAGIGIGHLPRHRVQHLLDSGELVELSVTPNQHPNITYLAWKLSHKGRALSTLATMLEKRMIS